MRTGGSFTGRPYADPASGDGLARGDRRRGTALLSILALTAALTASQADAAPVRAASALPQCSVTSCLQLAQWRDDGEDDADRDMWQEPQDDPGADDSDADSDWRERDDQQQPDSAPAPRDEPRQHDDDQLQPAPDRDDQDRRPQTGDDQLQIEETQARNLRKQLIDLYDVAASGPRDGVPMAGPTPAPVTGPTAPVEVAAPVIAQPALPRSAPSTPTASDPAQASSSGPASLVATAAIADSASAGGRKRISVLLYGPPDPGAAQADTDVTASISQAPDIRPETIDAMRRQDSPAQLAHSDDHRAEEGLRQLAPVALPAPLTFPGAPSAEAAQLAAPQGEHDINALAPLLQAALESPSIFAGSRLDAAQQAQLRAFYAARSGPLWLQSGAWNAHAAAVQARLEKAWEEGLEPADYLVPALPPGAAPAMLAEADVRLSIAAVKYARDAAGGRIDPLRLSKLLTPKRDLPDAEAVLARLEAVVSGRAQLGETAMAGDAGNVLASYNPQHPGYVALRGKLIELRAARPPQPPMARVPQGPTLRVGMSDPRVALVRSRLGLTPSDDVLYDEQLAAAVAEFQRERGMKPSGRLTPQTVIAMAGDRTPAAQDPATLIVNMERWRWLPRSLGDDYIFVNIPEYRMRLVRGGQLVHEARVIVGKAETQTPVFSDTMQYVVINPYWNVPPSIMKNEFLPGLARDPDYAAKRGYEVIRRGDRIHVRQPPGERNALGHIKFMFPNHHAVYLHDTPSRALFGRERRAFSHGCVRVDNPMRFAELVLGDQWPQARIRRLIGKGERTVRLPQPLPVHLAYFTAAVDADGGLHAREDIYGLDRRMRAALGRAAP